MKMRNALGYLLLLFSLQSAAQTKYNVLFIVADGLRPAALGCYGNKYVVTPHFNELAQRGVTFQNAFCQQSSCAPSRPSMVTGLRPDTLKITSGNIHFRSVLPDVVTLPQLFKQHGYYTQAIGLVSHAHPAQPDNISWSVPESLLDIPKRDEYLLPANRTRGFINRMEKGTATEAVDAPDNAYQDGQVAQLAIETLATKKDEPFFLAIGFKRPHLPYTMPKKYWDLYKDNEIPMPIDDSFPDCTDEQAKLRYSWSDVGGEMRPYTDIPDKGLLTSEQVRRVRHGYYAAISYVDAQIGRVLHALDSLGLAKNTIIVLWSDHGLHLGERGLWGKNDLTEDANHVPLIIAVPQLPAAGKKSAALIEMVDVYPTLAELCHLPAPTYLQGTSLTALLQNPARPWKKAVFSRYPRTGNTVMGYSVRTAQYRYNEWVQTATGQILDRELYDVIADPGGYKNLVDQKSNATTVSEMKTLLQKGWRNISIPK